MTTNDEPDRPHTPDDIPDELWLFWNGRGWLLSIDESPGDETYLVAFSEVGAKLAAQYQNELYDLNCTPVRVK